MSCRRGTRDPAGICGYSNVSTANEPTGGQHGANVVGHMDPSDQVQPQSLRASGTGRTSVRCRAINWHLHDMLQRVPALPEGVQAASQRRADRGILAVDAWRRPRPAQLPEGRSVGLPWACIIVQW